MKTFLIFLCLVSFTGLSNASTNSFSTWEAEYKKNEDLFLRSKKIDELSQELNERKRAEKPRSIKWEFYKEYSDQFGAVYSSTVIIASVVQLAIKAKPRDWEIAYLSQQICERNPFYSEMMGGEPAEDKKNRLVLELRIATGFANQAKVDKKTKENIVRSLAIKNEMVDWMADVCQRLSDPKNWN